MLDDWFDERFRAAGARGFFFSPVRALMALVTWAALGLGADWRSAGFWMLTVILLEWPMREITRPMARGLTLSRAEAVICMAIYAVTNLAWSAAGAILWAQGHMASQLAAAAFFAGQILYLTALHGRSMGALIPAMPALAAPAIAPLAVPHYHGLDQVLVEATMLAMVAQATIGVAVNLREARKLQPAEPARVSERGETRSAGAPDIRPAADFSWVRPLRVLAAEDNAVNQLVLRTLLAQVGVEPVMVGDGRAAVDAWAREPWDLILMDAQMPVMDGPSAARAIRAAEASSGRARTPIVALAADVTSHQAADCEAAGMDGRVAKPIAAAALFAALQRALLPEATRLTAQAA